MNFHQSFKKGKTQIEGQHYSELCTQPYGIIIAPPPPPINSSLYLQISQTIDGFRQNNL